jgi:hypothetical protein
MHPAKQVSLRMKIFVSSVITGMEAERASAKEAILQLRHEPIMAEDFRAQPCSPQVACLNELRQCAAAVLLVGAEYGTKQPSGFRLLMRNTGMLATGGPSSHSFRMA